MKVYSSMEKFEGILKDDKEQTHRLRKKAPQTKWLDQQKNDDDKKNGEIFEDYRISEQRFFLQIAYR